MEGIADANQKFYTPVSPSTYSISSQFSKYHILTMVMYRLTLPHFTINGACLYVGARDRWTPDTMMQEAMRLRNNRLTIDRYPFLYTSNTRTGNEQSMIILIRLWGEIWDFLFCHNTFIVYVYKKDKHLFYQLKETECTNKTTVMFKPCSTPSLSSSQPISLTELIGNFTRAIELLCKFVPDHVFLHHKAHGSF